MGKVVGRWPPHTCTHMYTIHRNTKGGRPKEGREETCGQGLSNYAGMLEKQALKSKNSERMHTHANTDPENTVCGQDLVWFLALVFLFLWESWNVYVWWALVYPPSYIWRVLNIESELQAQNAISAHSLHIDVLCLLLSRCRSGLTTSLHFAILSIWKSSPVYHLGLEISL